MDANDNKNDQYWKDSKLKEGDKFINSPFLKKSNIDYTSSNAAVEIKTSTRAH